MNTSLYFQNFSEMTFPGNLFCHLNDEIVNRLRFVTGLSSLKIFSAHFSSSVTFASIILSSFNCYCWTSITMEFIYLNQVLCPLNIKGQPTPDHTHVFFIAQLGDHCTGNAKVVGSNPFQSLFFQVKLFSSSVMAAFASI